MRISGVRTTSLVDGIGINYVIFAQGCTHKCAYCHNPSSWDLNGGVDIPVERLIKSIEPYLGFITGVTFSGGDPVLQIWSVTDIAKWAKEHDLTTTLYTGYYLDYVVRNFGDSLKNIDYIIDGEYQHDLSKSSPRFRGSNNQGMWQQVAYNRWISV